MRGKEASDTTGISSIARSALGSIIRTLLPSLLRFLRWLLLKVFEVRAATPEGRFSRFLVLLTPRVCLKIPRFAVFAKKAEWHSSQLGTGETIGPLGGGR